MGRKSRAPPWTHGSLTDCLPSSTHAVLSKRPFLGIRLATARRTKPPSGNVAGPPILLTAVDN